MKNLLIVIKGCAGKEHKYQQLLYTHYYGYALKIVFRYMYRYEKAVDVTNDGFVKLFRWFEKFNASGETAEDNERLLMGYIKRIMINTAIDELRKGRMLPEIGGIPENIWEKAGKDQDADQLILYKDLISMVKQLPPQYRIVFNMYVIDGYNHHEIADILKTAVGTSKSALSRARILLQKAIQKSEEEKVCSI